MTTRWTASLRRAALFTAAVAAAAVPAARVNAQLAYDGTTFLHGLGSSDLIWTTAYPGLSGRTPQDYLSSQVYLKNVEAPWLNEGAPGTKDRTAGLRFTQQRDILVRYLTGAGGRHVLVGHSAGSLVARGAYRTAGVGSQRVTGIVTIAAPHQGALIADSATQALGYVSDMQNAIKAAEGNVKLYVTLALVLSASLHTIEIGIAEFLTALELQGGTALPAGGITDIPRLELIKDLGPDSATIRELKAYVGDGGIPRGNVRGSIPYAHALLRLAAGSGGPSFEELKRRKDKGLSLLRKCKNMGNWTFNATDPGNKCQRAANMLGALDGRWAAYVNGTTCNGPTPGGGCWRQEPRKVPFDGVVPNERSAYPSTTTATAPLRDYTVPGASHVDIYKGRDGLNATAQAMLDLQMQRGTGFAASVSVPSQFNASTTLTWTAKAFGGSGAYAYQWSYRVYGSNTWTNFGSGGTSASRTVSTATSSFDVRVTVTSGGLTTSAQRAVTNTSTGTEPCVPPPGQRVCS